MTMRRHAALLATSLLACGLAACEPHHRAGAVDALRLVAADKEPGNWMTQGRTYSEQRFSPLDAVNTGNVDKLALAWSFELSTNRGVEATPIVVDGVMYVTSAWSLVYALDAKTGALLWKYDPKVPRETGFHACCDVVNRGVAIWGGKVYVATLDGRLAALDAKTGVVDWSVVTVDQSQPYTITMAPRVIKGKVIIGNCFPGLTVLENRARVPEGPTNRETGRGVQAGRFAPHVQPGLRDRNWLTQDPAIGRPRGTAQRKSHSNSP